MNSQPKVLIAVFLVLSSGLASLANDGNALSDFQKSLYDMKGNFDEACCDRAFYSKSFDLWINAFANGDEQTMNREWSKMLKLCGKTKSLRPLYRSAFNRLTFIEGSNGDKIVAKGGALSALKSMQSETQKILGANALVPTGYDYISDIYWDDQNNEQAVFYARKSVASAEQAFGKNGSEVARYLSDLSKKLVSAKKYEEAEHVAARAVLLSARGGSAEIKEKARTMHDEALAHLKRKTGSRH